MSAEGKRAKLLGRLVNGDRVELVTRLGGIILEGDPTPFVFEGPLRHGIRSALCLQGWPWAVANVTATELVGEALAGIGAKRPTWAQGQPWHTEGGVVRVAWARCARCHGELPPSDQHRKYCSRLCRDAAHRAREHHDEDRTWDAQRKATQELRMIQRIRSKMVARGAARP